MSKMSKCPEWQCLNIAGLFNSATACADFFGHRWRSAVIRVAPPVKVLGTSY
jgi:hypothetical protein